MAALPPPTAADPTLDAIASAIEDAARLEESRGYLGMSSIGMDCERMLWYQFRFCAPPGNGFTAPTLCNFEDGHRTEDVMADRLRRVPGVKLHTINPSDGKQFGFKAVGGHFRGHIDGAILGILQAPRTWHIWEHKASEKGVSTLIKAKADVGEKQALAKWNPVYHAQAIMYMDRAEITRHYLTVTGPGGRMPWTSVRTNADPAEAQRLTEKAERIIYSAEPLPRLSDDPAHWKCKGCALATVCHTPTLPPVSCRTCLHATPEPDGDGRWSCAKYGADIPLDAQREGCAEHRYIPALLARWGEAVDASEAEGWVEYKAADGLVFRNGPWGPGSYSSRELEKASPGLLRDSQFLALRAKYEGRVVEYKEAA